LKLPERCTALVLRDRKEKAEEEQEKMQESRNPDPPNQAKGSEVPMIDGPRQLGGEGKLGRCWKGVWTETGTGTGDSKLWDKPMCGKTTNRICSD
jgi:hypothetical protein